MSRVASVERDDARGVAAFPGALPCFNAGARSGHRDNLTRCVEKWKWCVTVRFRGRLRRLAGDRKGSKMASYTICSGLGQNGPPGVVSFRKKLFLAGRWAGTAAGAT